MLDTAPFLSGWEVLSEWFRWQELGGEADGSNLEIVTEAEPFKRLPR